MAHSDVLSAVVQQPPPEEAVPLPPRTMNPTQRMATRLMLANRRETAWRGLRMEGTGGNYRTDESEIKALWYQLARQLMVQDCTNPERFIHAQYHYGIPKSATLLRGPFSHMLLTEEAYKRYLQYDARANASLKQDLQSYTLSFEMAATEVAAQYPSLSSKGVWDFVLMNKMYELSPLFRFCLAVSEYLFETAAAFRDEALQQLLSDPKGYIVAWGDIIPGTLIDEIEVIVHTQLREGSAEA